MVGRVKSFLFENKTERQTIAKNTFWLFSGTLFSRLIRAAMVVYAARVLGVEQWGIFSYIFGIAAFLTVFADFGISALVTRESSKDLSNQSKYFSTAVVIKAIISLVMIIGVLIIAPRVISDQRALELIPVIVLMLLLDSFRDFGSSLCRAWEKMEIESVIQVVTNVFIAACGLIALYLSRTAFSFSVGYAVGVLGGTIIAFYPFRRYFENFFQKFSKDLLKKIIISSWSFGMLGVMASVMLNTDIVMIKWFGDYQSVGLYGAVQRIAQLIYIIPALLAVAFFPSMSRLFSDKEKFSRILEEATSLMVLISIPLALGGALLSKDVVTVLFGQEYFGGYMAFRIISLTFPLVFVSYILGNAVFSLNQEKKLITYVLLGIFGNIFLNLLFIPYLGIEGAAVSTLINQMIITAYLFFKVKKDIKFNPLRQLNKIVLSSLIMAAVVMALKYFGVSIYPIVLAGIICYFGILLALREKSLVAVKNEIAGFLKNK